MLSHDASNSQQRGPMSFANPRQHHCLWSALHSQARELWPGSHSAESKPGAA